MVPGAKMYPVRDAIQEENVCFLLLLLKAFDPPALFFIKVRTSFSRLSGGFRQFLAVFRRLSAGFQAAHRTKQKWYVIFYKWV